jgi:hypothetical protein
MKLRFLAPLAGGLALASALVVSDADACGGCFAPPTFPTVVTGHRMALSITTTQTVLWDQIQYSGDPAEFAWVLPVKPGAFIEVSTDAWFETLDAATNVQVVQPPITCESPFSFGGGCGSANEAGAFADDVEGASSGGGGPKVDVVHRGTVGPYETVTLSTMEPGALNAWLTKFGFAVDPSTQPTIDAYVKEGFDFIAIRLQPDKGVREMKPVRVVSPGASPALPLRMVAIGTGAEVAVTLFVIGEGRWAAENFSNAQVPLDLLSWDFKDSTSNYASLRKQTLEASEGKSAWLTTYSRQNALLSPVSNQFTFFNVNYGQDPNGVPLDTIAEAYLSQGILNKETALEGGSVDEEACRVAFSSFEINEGSSSSLVKNPCPMGAPLDDPECGTVAAGEIDARVFACGALDDLAAALNGAHPSTVTLTRLEAALPQAALQKDLTLAPAKDQKGVENWLQARIAVNPESFCGSFTPPAVWSTPGGRSWGSSLAGMSLAGLALAGVLARRRRLRRA